jgi:hypothetical protein
VIVAGNAVNEVSASGAFTVTFALRLTLFPAESMAVTLMVNFPVTRGLHEKLDG